MEGPALPLDDTTLILRSPQELKYALKAIDRWCLATGMKENRDKREGVAMGNLRHLSGTKRYNVAW